jgi:quinol monooxygenase YgiN
MKLLIAVLCTFALGACLPAMAQQSPNVVRIAELQIDAVQLEAYKTALTEEIETSIRIEPGVLTLYAVAEKTNPAHITIFEIYADESGYKAHLETAHFKKYKGLTKDMVKSLKLVEVTPVVMLGKGR